MKEVEDTSQESLDGRREAIGLAEKLLKDVKPQTEGGRDDKGKLTMTRLRRMLELASKADIYEEFKLKLLYLVARNTARDERELEDFAKAFIRELENKREEDRLSLAKLTLEYAVMAYAAKQLEEGVG
jgi:undecaprenyl pyrophosphate synthase